MKPTQNGYYWLRREGKPPTVVAVFGFETPDGASVALPGIANYMVLSRIDGEWSGPLVSPWEGEGKV